MEEQSGRYLVKCEGGAPRFLECLPGTISWKLKNPFLRMNPIWPQTDCLAFVLSSAQGITMNPEIPTSISGVTLKVPCLPPSWGLICSLPNSWQFLPAIYFSILIPIVIALGQASKSPPFSVPHSTSLLLTLMPHLPSPRIFWNKT